MKVSRGRRVAIAVGKGTEVAVGKSMWVGTGVYLAFGVDEVGATLPSQPIR